MNHLTPLSTWKAVNNSIRVRQQQQFIGSKTPAETPTKTIISTVPPQPPSFCNSQENNSNPKMAEPPSPISQHHSNFRKVVETARLASNRATTTVMETIVIRPRSANRSKEKILQELEEVKQENTTLRRRVYVNILLS
jgi:hypothetical protein